MRKKRKHVEIVLPLGGDLLAKKQYRQEAIRKWRLKKMKRSFPVSDRTYVNIQTSVALPNVDVTASDSFRQEGKKKAIKRWKAKKSRSQSVETSVTVFSGVNAVRQHCTLEPIFMQFKGLVCMILKQDPVKIINPKKSKKHHLKDGRPRLASILVTPLVLRSVPNCLHCLAKKFEYETYSLCCLDGVLQHNPYVKFLRRLKDVPNLTACQIILKTSSDVDQRVFNQPEVSQSSGCIMGWGGR
ncbi:ribosomal RNA small subunit methyltransferase B [Striga asiatica]|uniref:Ribosomal RNA small subunit methyltransferase B n=1 Tax=Striga asiatica TaxID=4170 RepID=A0A5A7NX75_STRAF|nr:ribosomal RNA small subunit methyltransferase B [Striga asiatica]